MISIHKYIFLLLIVMLPAAAYADIYRYETENGEIILTTQPRKDLKLIEVIRDSKSSTATASNTQKSNSSSQQSVRKIAANTASATGTDNSHNYDAYIAEASKLYNIPEAFIKAVIKIESNFNPRAVSRVGAMGLMQLMPSTAAHMNVQDPFDPRQNILGGTKYLRRLADRYDGDINLVLSGYHAGPGNVEKAGGIPFEKTRDYVKNVYSWYIKYKNE